MEMLARSVAAFRAATRLASASTTRCCAAVGGSAALRMRYTPCGCRSAHLVEVRSNSRLPPVSTMRRAKQCRYFASSLPPSKRHSRLTVVRRGCNRCRIAGIHGEAMYTAPDSAGRAALQATSPQCEFSLGGCKGGVSLFEKEIPLPYPHPLRGAGNGCSAAALPISLPLRETPQPGGQVMSRPART